MSKLDNILHSFQFKDCYDFVCSIMPSMKHEMTIPLFILSAYLTTLSSFMGLKSITVIAFVILCLLELVSGVYASVVIRRDKIQSVKASRFTIKLAAIMIVLFVLNTFNAQFAYQNTVASGFFEWLYLCVFCWFALEYLISVIENIGHIYGQSTNKLVMAIKMKFSKFFDIEGINETPPNETK